MVWQKIQNSHLVNERRQRRPDKARRLAMYEVQIKHNHCYYRPIKIPPKMVPIMNIKSDDETGPSSRFTAEASIASSRGSESLLAYFCCMTCYAIFTLIEKVVESDRLAVMLMFLTLFQCESERNLGHINEM